MLISGTPTNWPKSGDPEAIHIEETSANFRIDRKGHWRIEGAAFVFVEGTTRGTRAILGHPTQKQKHAYAHRPMARASATSIASGKMWRQRAAIWPSGRNR